MAQHTIELPCIKDTWIDESNPNTSHGSDSTLIGGDFNGSSSGGRAYALLAFDWSSLPARKKITGIKLKFYNVNSLELGGASYCQFVIGCMQGTWDESTTWHTNPYTYIGSGPNYLENVNIPGSQYYEITLSLSDVMYQNRIVNNGIFVDWHKVIDNQVQPSYVTMHSRENTYPPMLVVTYEDVPPSAPTPKSPIGTYKDNKSIIRFEWQHNSDVGGTQKAFDLQWSTDQANWTTVSLTTANNYYDMPANTLPAGNIYWRVRCYNEYDEVGPYCDIQSFYAIGAPAAPVLNAIPSNTARPVVTWSAFNQQVYQLQVLSGDTIVYDSGVVPGISIRQHKIKAWLADGEYTVKLRIKNEYDLWSEWGSATFEIATAKPTKPSVNLQRAAYGIELHIEDIADYALIFRADYDTDDYICIGKTTSATYVDNSVRNKGEYKYFIRSVSADETFEDSDIKFAQAEFQYSLLAPVSDLSKVFVFARSLNAPPKRTYSHQLGGAFVEYVGRKHPVWEPTEHIAAAWSMAFYLKNWTDVEDFVALVNRKETVLYRDAKGRKVYGVLGNLSVNDERGGYMVSFTLTEVDYNEELEV